jgi:hypothetical protein
LDGKFLVTLCGDPYWQLTYWSWDQNKVLASQRVVNFNEPLVTQISINPYENIQVLLLTRKSLQLYKYRDGKLGVTSVVQAESLEVPATASKPTDNVNQEPLVSEKNTF